MSEAEFHVLYALKTDIMHGYKIIKAIEKNGLYTIASGTLYPLLKRFVEKGFIEELGLPKDKRTTNYYQITYVGRQALEYECAKMRSIVEMVNQ